MIAELPVFLTRWARVIGRRCSGDAYSAQAEGGW